MFTSVRSEQKGVSLLELMLALVVISALLLLATRYYQQTRESLRVAQAIEMINNVTKASYKLLEGKPNFSNIGINSLVMMEFVPTWYQNPDANPWKGTIDVRPYTAPNISGEHLAILLTKIPAKSCQQLWLRLRSRSVGIATCTDTGGGLNTFTVFY